MRRDEFIYDETLPPATPVLIIRWHGCQRILIHPSWGPIIAEVGLEGAVQILDDMFGELNRQDGMPNRERRAYPRLRAVAS